jgi:hypothetical protein
VGQDWLCRWRRRCERIERGFDARLERGAFAAFFLIGGGYTEETWTVAGLRSSSAAVASPRDTCSIQGQWLPHMGDCHFLAAARGRGLQ